MVRGNFELIGNFADNGQWIPEIMIEGFKNGGHVRRQGCNRTYLKNFMETRRRELRATLESGSSIGNWAYQVP